MTIAVKKAKQKRRPPFASQSLLLFLRCCCCFCYYQHRLVGPPNPIKPDKSKCSLRVSVFCMCVSLRPFLSLTQDPRRHTQWGSAPNPSFVFVCLARAN